MQLQCVDMFHFLHAFNEWQLENYICRLCWNVTNLRHKLHTLLSLSKETNLTGLEIIITIIIIIIIIMVFAYYFQFIWNALLKWNVPQNVVWHKLNMHKHTRWILLLSITFSLFFTFFFFLFSSFNIWKVSISDAAGGSGTNL